MEWLTRFTECVFLRGPPHVSSTSIYESDGSPVLFFPPSLPHLPSFLRQRCARWVVYTVKYILVWRWTDKGFSIDRLKYKLRLERSSPPIYTDEIILPAFYSVHLSTRKGPKDFHAWKGSFCLYYYSCYFPSCSFVTSFSIVEIFLFHRSKADSRILDISNLENVFSIEKNF